VFFVEMIYFFSIVEWWYLRHWCRRYVLFESSSRSKYIGQFKKVLGSFSFLDLRLIIV
jgi:hypothetical protein